VAGLLSVARDGKVALFAVGGQSKDRLAREGKSALAIFEFLVKVPPPCGTFQAAIDALPGVSSKLLDGARRVRRLVITTDLDEITSLLKKDALAPLLKDEHTTALRSEEATHELATEVRSMLVTLEQKSQYAPKRGRTEAAAEQQRQRARTAATTPGEGAARSRRAGRLIQ